MNCCSSVKAPAAIVLAVSFACCGYAQIRDGGIDPKNLGKGVWVYSITDATNHVGGHVAGVTNLTSLMQFYRASGIRYFIVKAATSDQLFNGCYSGPQFTSGLVNAAHANGIAIFGYNRSYGANIAGEVAIADYVFNQGADGFVFDAEAEWETGHAWITNGPAQAWQLCSTVRSNWPNKFLAHAPFPIIYLHSSFPYKEFGFWCDAVMPQIYHFSSSGLKGSPSAAINWSDVNWDYWQNSLSSLPPSTINGVTAYWTNAIKPIVPLRDVYGEVVSGGIICEGAAGVVYPDDDVQEFMDYTAADPNAQTAGGYRGVNFWRADTIGAGQWANIAAGTSGVYSNIVNDLVLDDARATFTGGWTFVRTFNVVSRTSPQFIGAFGTDTNSFGTNYFYRARGDGSAFAQFMPEIGIPGNYDLYEWHPYLANAAADTPFQVISAGVTNTVLVNQQTNSGNWSFIGRFYFPAGNTSAIRVLDNFSDVTKIAAVDGLKLSYANADIILDNTNSEVAYNGSWTTGSSAVGRYQADYRFVGSESSVTATATYRPNFPNAGLYDVSIWYPQGGNRAPDAPWTISCLDGTTNVPVNQQVNGGSWLAIATGLPFGAGAGGFVQLANNASPGVVLADAVKFSFAGPLSPVLIQDLTRQADGRVALTVSSTPGYPVYIERATNLFAWQTLANLVNTNGTLIFTDNSATNNEAGFYRVHQ